MFRLPVFIALLGRFQSTTPTLRRSALDHGLGSVVRIFGVSNVGPVELVSAITANDGANPRSRKSLNDRGGFALVLFLSLLPAGLALMFALFAGTTVIQERRIAMNACRRDLLNGLALAADPMERLLTMNVAAKALRTRQGYLALALAASATNPAAAGIIATQLAANRRNQEELDRFQKLLYRTAEARLNAAQTAALAQFVSRKTWLKIWAWPPRFSHPALHPVGPGPAPDWEKDDRFSESQTLEQKWQWSFIIQGTAAAFLRGSHTQEETCSATLDDQGSSFKAVLR